MSNTITFTECFPRHQPFSRHLCLSRHAVRRADADAVGAEVERGVEEEELREHVAEADLDRRVCTKLNRRHRRTRIRKMSFWKVEIDSHHACMTTGFGQHFLSPSEGSDGGGEKTLSRKKASFCF